MAASGSDLAPPGRAHPDLVLRARSDLVVEVPLLPKCAPNILRSPSHDHLLEIHGETVAITTEMPSIFSILAVLVGYFCLMPRRRARDGQRTQRNFTPAEVDQLAGIF